MTQFQEGAKVDMTYEASSTMSCEELRMSNTNSALIYKVNGSLGFFG